jgi:PadR family transcriptional regulator PadR
MPQERVDSVRRPSDAVDASMGLLDDLGQGGAGEIGQLDGLEVGPRPSVGLSSGVYAWRRSTTGHDRWVRIVPSPASSTDCLSPGQGAPFDLRVAKAPGAGAEPRRVAEVRPLTIGRYLPMILGMRRKRGTLLPIEEAILAAGIELRRSGTPEFHGFLVAKALRERDEARRLTAHGTLYKALDRLEKAGLLTSRWEDALLAADAGRPRRRLYTVTALGERALAQAQAAAGSAAPPVRPGLEPS